MPDDNDWPGFPSGCPASEQPYEPLGGPVFMLLRHLREQDYTTALERGAYPKGSDCRRRSHSCFKTITPLEEQLKASPKIWRGIARADLEARHGVIKHTPSDGRSEHHSMWLRAEYPIRPLFVELVLP